MKKKTKKGITVWGRHEGMQGGDLLSVKMSKGDGNVFPKAMVFDGAACIFRL